MSNEDPRVGPVDPAHIGPHELILDEVVAPSDVPADVRIWFDTFAEMGETEPASLPVKGGAVQARPPLSDAQYARWGDVTFAGRAIALVEGTDQPGYEDSDDPRVWVFALRADYRSSATRSSR